MTASYTDIQARRVVTGLDANGKSTIVFDDNAPARLVTPGNTKCDLWRINSLPAGMGDWDGLDVGVLTSPSETGLVYRLTSVPPDNEWDKTVGYRDANGPLPGSVDPADANGLLGMHFTETIDFVTVLSGEIYAVLETGEALLHPGDTLVQRGTVHTWSNRTDAPVVILSVMLSAKR